MNILYGVTGVGLGHTMRARVLASHLVARGHRVKVAASGRAVAVLRRHGLDVVAIDGMKMRIRGGELRRARSVVGLLAGAPSALRANLEVALGEIARFGPEAVVTDFDSFAHAVGLAWGLPIVSFDHQHVVDRFAHPLDVVRRVSAWRLTRALVRAKLPGCTRYVVTSFFFPEPARDAVLVGPVVRPEIEAALPTRGEHVVVYQTAAGDPRLLAALRAVRGARFVVYGLGVEARIGNVELRAFDEARFVRDLASARAVVANGGFTTLSEAIYLGKPLLSVPIKKQPEQELNAAYVERLGYGQAAERFDRGVLERFLARVDAFAPASDARIERGTRDAERALDDALAEVA